MAEEYKENPVQSYPGIDWAVNRWKDPAKGYIIPPVQRKIYNVLAAQYQGKSIVDIGSSFGVGSNILSHRSLSVWALDLSEELVKFGRDLFASPRLSFDVYDILNPPVRPHYEFDVVLFLEVIEHLPRADWDKAMNNLKRFFRKTTEIKNLPDPETKELKPVEVTIEGIKPSVGFISTPNRNSSEIQDHQPANEQHTYEASAGELYEFLIKHFRNVTLYSVDKLKAFEQGETVDGNTQDTPILVKIEGVITK